MAAAAGVIAGAGIGAGGGIAGAILAADAASTASGDQIFPFVDPSQNLALQASEFDALNLIGFGDIGNVPGPLDQFLARVNAMPMTNRARRRALKVISKIREAGVTSLNDPVFRRTTDGFRPSGALGPEAEQGKFVTDDVRSAKRLRNVLAQMGVTEAEFSDILKSDIEFKENEKRLSEELGTRNETTIRNRATTAATASQLLADSAGFASTGLPQSDLQSDFLNRINRGIDDQEDQLLLRAQFGGFQPGAGLEGLNRQRTDATLTALEQSLAASAGLTAGLGGGLDFAQRAASLSTGAGLGAAGLSASQAIAANSIRAQGDAASGAALGNGIASGAAAFGTGISNAAFLSQFQQSPLNTTPVTFAPVSNPEFNTGFGNIQLKTQFGP